MSYHQDLNALTRDMHDKTWMVEYMKKNPVTAMLLERKTLQFKGGKKYSRNADTDTQESLAQDYGNNTTLSHGVKDTTFKPQFQRKYIQFPVQIDLDENLQNAMQTEDRTQLQNLAAFRVRKAQEGMRVHLRKKIYMSANSSFATQPGDSNIYMQGLNSALEVDTTYGEITRTYSTGIKTDAGFWFQPAGGALSPAVQVATKTISINWLRTVQEPLEDLESDNTDLVTILGGVLWLSLQAEAETKNMPYKLVGDRVAKQGFTEMILDGRRIIKDPFLKAFYNTSMGEVTAAAGALEMRIYIINLMDWEFFIHPSRNFKMSEFFDQSKLMNGTDSELARIKFAGNLVCFKPGANTYYEYVSP